MYRESAKPPKPPKPKVRLGLPTFHAVMLGVQLFILTLATIAYYMSGALVRGTSVLLAIVVQVVVSWYYWKRAVEQAKREAELREERQRWFDEH